LFWHYRTLTTLFGKKLHQQYKDITLCKSQQQVTLNTIFSAVKGEVSDMNYNCIQQLAYWKMVVNQETWELRSK
jgi:hypothetical protein